MASQILGAWFELQCLAIVGAAATSFWFARVNKSEHCKSSLAAAAEGREAMLRETCYESDSGWARVVRFALRQGPVQGRSQQQDYRSAPTPVASRGLARCYRRERWRLRLATLFGVGCAEGAFAVSALMFQTPGFLGFALGTGALALALAVSVIAHGRRTSRALRLAFDAMPRVLLDLEPPAPARLPLESGEISRFDQLSSWAGLLILVPGMLVLLGGLTHLSQSFEADRLGAVILSRFLLTLLLLLPAILCTQTRVVLDAAQQELVVIRSLFGGVYRRIVLPLEIIRWFHVGHVDGEPSKAVLSVDLGAGKATLATHADSPRIALELNQMLSACRSTA